MLRPVGLALRGGAALPLKRGRIALSESRIERDGLKPGVQAPVFTLPAIDGQNVSLDQYRGRKVLLVFSDPQCGPCNTLAPDLVRFHSEHGNNGVAVVMVGRGDAEQNRKKAAEHGIGFPVVLQERWKLSRQYGIFATPVAFLISKDGVIMRDVAKGVDEIIRLARESLASA
jgi:peroxiredoxin